MAGKNPKGRRTGRSNRVRFVAEKDTDAELEREMDRASMLIGGRITALRIVDQIRATIVDADPNPCATGDGGITLLFEDKNTGRELTYMLPDDGSWTYVVAEPTSSGGDWSRKVSSHTLHAHLAAWLCGDTNSLPD